MARLRSRKRAHSEVEPETDDHVVSKPHPVGGSRDLQSDETRDRSKNENMHTESGAGDDVGRATTNDETESNMITQLDGDEEPSTNTATKRVSQRNHAKLAKRIASGPVQMSMILYKGPRKRHEKTLNLNGTVHSFEILVPLRNEFSHLVGLNPILQRRKSKS